ncbi:small leucine-rich protein 1 [Pelodytes ibericus]
MGDIISVFVRELPALYIFGGIFLPVTLLLLAIMSYLMIQLNEVNRQLAQARDPKEALQDYYYQYSTITASQRASHKKT